MAATEGPYGRKGDFAGRMVGQTDRRTTGLRDLNMSLFRVLFGNFHIVFFRASIIFHISKCKLNPLENLHPCMNNFAHVDTVTLCQFEAIRLVPRH